MKKVLIAMFRDPTFEMTYTNYLEHLLSFSPPGLGKNIPELKMDLFGKITSTVIEESKLKPSSPKS